MRLRFFQSHPDPNLRRHWNVMQWAVLLMPINTLVGCVTILVTSLTLWKSYANQLVQNFVNQALLLLGCWMVIIALFAENNGAAFGGLFNFLPFFVVFIAQSRLIQTPEQLRRLAWIIISPSVIIVVLGWGQLFLKWYFHWKFLSIDGSSGILLDWTIAKGGEPLGRMSSLFYYATVLASYFVTTLTLTLGLLIEQWKTRRSVILMLLLSGIAGLNLVGIFLTNSRNAWVLALGLIVTFATYIGWRWVGALVMWLVIAVLEASYAPPPLSTWFRTVVPEAIWARVNDDMFVRPLASLRTTQWEFAWNMIQQRPFSGWGLRNFSALYQDATGFFVGHPHNLPLMLSAEMGVPATVLFYGLIGWILYMGVQRFRQAVDRGDQIVIFTYVVAFLACSLFSLLDVTLFDARINTLQWLILAAIWGISLTPKTRRSDS
ncbi:O-antigen ligase family protein [filamentous cyanobacterium LEGE 11480]|uniref:O-antigen ligase family protein n=1 Tax=Romeriopsis navalis LEGE 11480 TaxID=2777977 RepID=A0A928VMA5_9CYAN|nr:O-antigen ligase family protein [Romeriopsis navalis]MBE9030930.1 O-antigen ligase family protein [Romeriopsis navalis LEGE 11480]